MDWKYNGNIWNEKKINFGKNHKIPSQVLLDASWWMPRNVWCGQIDKSRRVFEQAIKAIFSDISLLGDLTDQYYMLVFLSSHILLQHSFAQSSLWIPLDFKF